ncbi:MAG: hypothetical protein ACTS22_02595 [Phycisphaerales bacterium]
MIVESLTLADLANAIADELDHILIVVGIIVIVSVVTISGTIRKTVMTRQREQTKRELAAYVAEGSMSPDDAQKILRSGESDDLRELVLKRAADGWISAKKAEQILRTMESDARRA